MSQYIKRRQETVKTANNMALMLLLNAGIFISLCSMATGKEFTGEEKNNNSEKYCYRLESQQMNWERAACHCLRKSGNLVSIHSQEQQDFLTDNFLKAVSSRLWIGLHDTGAEGLYMWEDESRFDYINWNSGEPSHTIHTQEDCVEMCNDVDMIGTWNDVLCNIEHPFICQKRIQEKYPRNEDNSISCCFVNVPTFIITLIFIAALMAQIGGMIYYRRLWLEAQHTKLNPVIFKGKVQDNELSADVDIKNDDAYEESKYVHL